MLTAPFPICPKCGVLAPSKRSTCSFCAATFPEVPYEVPASSDDTAWVCVRFKFGCTVCGQSSPLNTFGDDDVASCAFCGGSIGLPPNELVDVLELAHASVDPKLRDFETFDRLGKTAAHLEYERTRIVASLAPGHPVCPTCAVLLVIERTPEGTHTRCPRCETTATHRLPAALARAAPNLRAALDDDNRLDVQEVKLEQGALASSIACPSCGAPLVLDANPTSIVACAHCKTNCHLALGVLRKIGAAPRMDPMWLLFEGPSKKRLDHQAKEETERLIEQRLAQRHARRVADSSTVEHHDRKLAIMFVFIFAASAVMALFILFADRVGRYFSPLASRAATGIASICVGSEGGPWVLVVDVLDIKSKTNFETFRRVRALDMRTGEVKRAQLLDEDAKGAPHYTKGQQTCLGSAGPERVWISGPGPVLSVRSTATGARMITHEQIAAAAKIGPFASIGWDPISQSAVVSNHHNDIAMLDANLVASPARAGLNLAQLPYLRDTATSGSFWIDITGVRTNLVPLELSHFQFYCTGSSCRLGPADWRKPEENKPLSTSVAVLVARVVSRTPDQKGVLGVHLVSLGGEQRKLSRFDEEGRPTWSFTPVGVGPATFDLDSDLLVVDARSVARLDQATGAVRFRFETVAPIERAFRHAGVLLVVTGTLLQGIDAASGKLLWKRDLG